MELLDRLDGRRRVNAGRARLTAQMFAEAFVIICSGVTTTLMSTWAASRPVSIIVSFFLFPPFAWYAVLLEYLSRAIPRHRGAASIISVALCLGVVADLTGDWFLVAVAASARVNAIVIWMIVPFAFLSARLFHTIVRDRHK